MMRKMNTEEQLESFGQYNVDAAISRLQELHELRRTLLKRYLDSRPWVVPSIVVTRYGVEREYKEPLITPQQASIIGYIDQQIAEAQERAFQFWRWTLPIRKDNDWLTMPMA